MNNSTQFYNSTSIIAGPHTPYIPPGHPAVKGIGGILKESRKIPEWIIEGLIEKGHQFVIGAGPKTGKSIMALQMCLAVANGEQFMNWNVPKKRRVLYINFELSGREQAERVVRMVGGEDNLQRYTNFYTYDTIDHGVGCIDIMNPEHQEEIAKMIAAIQPELIVFDTFVKIHHQKEGDAQEIVPVLVTLRKVCAGIAHVIIHHTRKPGPDQQGPQTANDLRGSGGIFGEPNGIFVLSSRTGQGARYVMTSSLRQGKQPDDMFLDRDDRTLKFVDPAERDASTLVQKLGEIFGNATVIESTTELVEGLKAAYNIEQRQAQKYLKNAVEGQFLRTVKNGRNVHYHLTLLAQRVIKNVG